MFSIYELKILDFIRHFPNSSSSVIHGGIGLSKGIVTTKRKISALFKNGYLYKEGAGRATRYFISDEIKFTYPIDIGSYFEEDIDNRKIIEYFNFELIQKVLHKIELFDDSELKHLNKLHKKYRNNISTLSKNLYKKDLERLGIDLSWKSSQIEGNTYSLLETEQLLKEKIEARGKNREEAIMLLNHKDALDYILDSPNYFLKINTKKIIEIHNLLTKGLDVEKSIRKRIVGITGTNYKPLDNEYQIEEAIIETCKMVNSKENIFEKAFILLILLSYIQAFEDGNKRTARLVSNAIMISNNYCPLSFRTVDSIDYKKAMLLFYEQNNISAIKKIFIEQYEFAVTTYFQ